MEICKCCRKDMQRLVQHKALMNACTNIYMEVKCVEKGKFRN